MNFSEIENWEPEELLNYIQFCDLLLNEKGKIPTSDKKIFDRAKSFLTMKGHINCTIMEYFSPFLEEPTRFFSNVKQILVQVLNTYRDNPAFLTENIRSHFERFEEYSWILIKAIPVIRESPDVVMANSLVSSINLMAEISQSITKKQIKEMRVVDKINALKTLSFVWKVLKDFRPNPKAFGGIDAQVAKREELEKKMLEQVEG